MAGVCFGSPASARGLSSSGPSGPVMVGGAGSRRRPRGAVDAALLGAAVVGILPGGSGTAFAQVTTIWSATLTVGTASGAAGWHSTATVLSGDNLTDTTVTYDGVNYPVDGMLVSTRGNRRLTLSFGPMTITTEGLFDPTLRALFQFRVGGRSFNLGNAKVIIGRASGHLTFEWNDSRLNWSRGDVVELSLVDARPKVTSARVIDPYVVEVTFNNNLAAAQPWGRAWVTVNGRRYPTGYVSVQCRRASHQNFGCRAGDTAKWVWIELQWPIFSNDTVRFNYSPDARGGDRLVDRALGVELPQVRNYTVTNNSSAGKSTVTIESIGATAPRAADSAIGSGGRRTVRYGPRRAS